MNDRGIALYAAYLKSRANARVVSVRLVESKFVYDLSPDLIEQIHTIAGEDWTYQFSTIFDGPASAGADNRGFILHFHIEDHALIFKLSSDLHLEVVS